MRCFVRILATNTIVMKAKDDDAENEYASPKFSWIQVDSDPGHLFFW